MAIASRKVVNKKNDDGTKSGKAGTVYDVNIKYKDENGNYLTYGKRGFLTKPEAQEHENEMRKKIMYVGYEPAKADEAKQTLKQYLETWVEVHGKANLRPSTISGYKSHINNHIIPNIGNVPLNRVTPKMIDEMLAKLNDRKLSQSTLRHVQRILSVAFEAARKYGYIDEDRQRRKNARSLHN